MEIGIFCGTFNPIHLGHLLIAECARDQFKLEKVYFVTSPSPPHRFDELLDGNDRHQLVKAAVSDNQNFEASSIELERSGPSYTIDTLKNINTKYDGKAHLNLIIGGDNLNQLNDWHQISELFKLARILVVPRLRYIKMEDDHLQMIGEEPENIESKFPHAELAMVDFPGIAISGSKIRERIEESKTILYMVPNSVNELIIQNGYFKNKSEVSRTRKSK